MDTPRLLRAVEWAIQGAAHKVGEHLPALLSIPSDVEEIEHIASIELPDGRKLRATILVELADPIAAGAGHA